MLSSPDRSFRRFCETGDPRHLGRVFDGTAKELLRVATYLTRDRHRAEDAVQATFLAAIEKAASYDRGRPVLPWLLAILANEARQLHRRERRALPPAAVVAASSLPADVADAAATAELARICDQALEALPEPYRPVLILHLRHGLAGHEIATTLQLPDSTVRNQIARGLDVLRRKLPASVAGAVVASAATGRGLGAVRATVLTHVPAPTPAIAAGAVAATGIIGGLFVYKHVAVAVTVLAFLVVGVWTFGWLAPESAAEAVLPSANAMAQAVVPLEPPPVVLVEAQRQAVVDVDTVAAPTSGSLLATVAIEGQEAVLGDAACSLWTACASGPERLVSEGRTATDGTIRFPELAPGAYCFVVDAPYHVRDVTIELGAATRLHCEVPPGHRCFGMVVDRDGRSVAGAEVRCARDWFSTVVARTSADGTFAIDLMSGQLELWAAIGGRQPSKRLELDVVQDTQVRLVLLDTGERLAGRVVDERGEAAAGVRVYIGFDKRIGSTECAQFERHDVRTDAAGNFAIDWARPGRVWVAAIPNDGDLGRASHRELVLPEGAPGSVQLQFGDGAVVAGVARDEAGHALVGATIRVWSRDSGLDPVDYRQVVTAEDGTYALRGLRPGKHDLQARRGSDSGAAGLGAVASVELEPRQHLVWNPVLRTGAPVLVRVVGADDLPVARRELSIAVGGSIVGNGRTDARGRCRFDHLSPVEHQLRVYGDMGNRVVLAERTVLPGAEESVIRIEAQQIPSARLSGRVVDGKGVPVPKAEVSCRGDNGRHEVEHVDSDGRFRTELLPPGRYSITVAGRTRGLGQAFSHAVLMATQEHDLGDLVLPVTASLVVRLRGPGGEVVREPMLRLGQAGEVQNRCEYIPPDEVDGAYRHAGIEPGDYVLHVFGPDMAPQNVPLSLAAGEQRELDLVATPAVPVMFEIRCALVNPRASGAVDVQLDVFDAAGERVAAMRVWSNFDDAKQRLERLRLGLLPGSYRVKAEEVAAKRIEVAIEVPATAPAQPFVIDLR